jgi:YidC/Oxa1 family membrane protein insertase
VFEPLINAFNAFRDALYLVLKFYQQLVEPVLGSQSYWFAIVMLTISVRVLLIPLTVKQVKASRAMSEIAPEIKKLQAKYKNDREKLNQEMMALYKERGANPLAGCLPILAQAPFFFALYQVIFADPIAGERNILKGQSFFGVNLDTHWWTINPFIDKFITVDGIVILLLIVAMGATTFISQRQLMSKQAAAVNPQQQMLMKILPLMFAVFAVNFPLAVIIYWVTTNLWSMGQQYILLRNRPPIGGEPAAATAGAGSAVVNGKSKAADDQPKGFMASLRSMIDQASDQVSSNRGQKPGDAKSSSNGNQPSRSKQSKAPGANTTARSKKGSTTGGTPKSPSRPGGGKSGSRSQQQRRRKR